LDLQALLWRRIPLLPSLIPLIVLNRNRYAFDNIPAVKLTASTIIRNFYFKISLKINLRGCLPTQLLSKTMKEKRSRFFNRVKKIERS
jgi:hypothetical protein